MNDLTKLTESIDQYMEKQQDKPMTFADRITYSNHMSELTDRISELETGMEKCIVLYCHHLGKDKTKPRTGGNRFYEIHYNDWHDAMKPVIAAMGGE